MMVISNSPSYELLQPEGVGPEGAFWVAWGAARTPPTMTANIALVFLILVYEAKVSFFRYTRSVERGNYRSSDCCDRNDTQ